MGAKASHDTIEQIANNKTSSYKTVSKHDTNQFSGLNQSHVKTSLMPVVSALNLKQFAKDMLTAHNDYRKAHGAPRMSLDESLCNYAQTWADVS